MAVSGMDRGGFIVEIGMEETFGGGGGGGGVTAFGQVRRTLVKGDGQGGEVKWTLVREGEGRRGGGGI